VIFERRAQSTLYLHEFKTADGKWVIETDRAAHIEDEVRRLDKESKSFNEQICKYHGKLSMLGRELGKMKKENKKLKLMLTKESK
jgi:hypothetical protein